MGGRPGTRLALDAWVLGAVEPLVLCEGTRVVASSPAASLLGIAPRPAFDDLLERLSVACGIEAIRALGTVVDGGRDRDSFDVARGLALEGWVGEVRARAMCGGRFVVLSLVDERELRALRAQRRELRAQLFRLHGPVLSAGLTASVVHDVRGLLMALAMELEGIDPPLRPDARARVHEVVQACSSVVALAADPPVEGTCVVDEVVRGLEPLARCLAGDAVGVTFSLGAGTTSVATSAVGLMRALINAIHNAVEASVGARRVEIRTECIGVAGRPMVRLAVSDDGCGIPSEHLPHVRMPQFSTKSDGAGLGLFVMEQFARAAGGSLRLDCPSAGGTRVVFELPTTGPVDETAALV